MRNTPQCACIVLRMSLATSCTRSPLFETSSAAKRATVASPPSAGNVRCAGAPTSDRQCDYPPRPNTTRSSSELHQPIRAMHADARTFADRQPRHARRRSDRLPSALRPGRSSWSECHPFDSESSARPESAPDRIDVRKLDRDFADRRQPLHDRFRDGRASAARNPCSGRSRAFLDLLIHRTRNKVARRQILQGRRVTLHESLAVAVQQNPALASHAFGDQHAGAGDTARMKLPELHVFERQSGARGRPARRRCRYRRWSTPQDPTGATGRQHRHLRLRRSSARRFPSQSRPRRRRRHRRCESDRAPSTRQNCVRAILR